MQEFALFALPRTTNGEADNTLGPNSAQPSSVDAELEASTRSIGGTEPNGSEVVEPESLDDQLCMGYSLPITPQALIAQNWVFSATFERTPEGASEPRPSIPSDLLGEGTGETVYRRQLQLPQCLPPCPQCPPRVCAVKRLGRNIKGQMRVAIVGGSARKI